MDRSEAVERAKAWWSMAADARPGATRRDSPTDADKGPLGAFPQIALPDLLVELAGVLDNERNDRSVSAEIGTVLSRLRLPDRDVLTRSAEWIGSVSATSRRQSLDFLRTHGAAVLESLGNGYAAASQRGEERSEPDKKVTADDGRFRLVFDNAAVAIAIGDTSGILIDANPALGAMLNAAPADLRGLTVGDLVHPDDQATIKDTILGDLVGARTGTKRIEIRLRRDDDTFCWTHFAVTFVTDDPNFDGYLLAVGEDITERRELEGVLYHQARHDPLTGLGNRLLLRETLQLCIDAAGAEDRIGLCYIDLDGFKAINDQYGHGTGDRLLAALSDRLRSQCAERHLIARVGGDEFVAILPAPTETDTVLDAARNLLSTLSAPYDVDGRELRISASIGVLVPKVFGTDADSLLDAVDSALYRAKAEGGGILVLHEP